MTAIWFRESTSWHYAALDVKDRISQEIKEELTIIAAQGVSKAFQTVTDAEYLHTLHFTKDRRMTKGDYNALKGIS